MGLGTDLNLHDDIEWFSVDDVNEVSEWSDAALVDFTRGDSVWGGDGATRMVLVDLDNLRAEPNLLQRRMSIAVDIARGADHAVFAGQDGAVGRASPSLAEFRPGVVVVGDGADEADHALLDAAALVDDHHVEFVVMSNDGIFAQLASRGRLTVLSPGAAAMSSRLRRAAASVIDLNSVVAADTRGDVRLGA